MTTACAVSVLGVILLVSSAYGQVNKTNTVADELATPVPAPSQATNTAPPPSQPTVAAQAKEDKAWIEYLQQLGAILAGTGDVTAEYKTAFGGKDSVWSGVIEDIEKPPAPKPGISVKMSPGTQFVQRLGKTLHCSVITLTPSEEEWKTLAKLKKGDSIKFATRPGVPAVLQGMGPNAGMVLLMLPADGLRLIK